MKRGIRDPGRGRRKRRSWLFLAVVLIALAAIAGIWKVSTSRATRAFDVASVPNLDTTDMEELVAEIITRARDGVLKAPDSYPAWRFYAAVLDAHDYFAEAEIAYRRALELAPDDSWCLYNLAVTLESLDADPDQILALYRKFAEGQPTFPPVHVRIGGVLARKGDLQGAAQAHRAALALDPKMKAPRRSLGQLLIALGDAPGAIVELERVAQQVPADGPTQAALAQAYTLTGDEARAAAAAARARELREVIGVVDPMRFEVDAQGRSAALASARAEERVRAGDFAGAVEDLKIVLRSTPTKPTLHERLAAAYQQLGQLDLAEKHRAEAQRLRAAQ